MIPLLAVALTVSVAASIALARRISPAHPTPILRRLARVAALLITSAAITSVVLALGVHGLAPVRLRFFPAGDNVERPSAADLRSLRGPPVRPRCDSADAGVENAGGGEEASHAVLTSRRCGPARFEVSIGSRRTPESFSESEIWTHQSSNHLWQCVSGHTTSSVMGRSERWSRSDEVSEVRLRTATDGTFAEYTCASLRCLYCPEGVCAPNPDGCRTLPPLYFRQRDTRGPITLAAFGVLLLALWTLRRIK